MHAEILNKISRLIASPMREADVQHLFTLARKLIDKVPRSDRQQFSLLKFYCDWTMHPDIDRSETGASILADTHNIIADLLLRCGAIGLMLFLLAVGLSLSQAIQTWRHAGDPMIAAVASPHRFFRPASAIACRACVSWPAPNTSPDIKRLPAMRARCRAA